MLFPLAPIFLFGTLTAGIPVLIHLLARRESVRVEWPTLRFLEETERRTARRRRIEQILLMLLRAAIMLLLAVGLSRPVLRYAGAARGDASVVVVLDDTLSSRATEEGEDVFDRERSGALRALEGLKEHALCGLVRVSGLDDGAEGGMTQGPGRVREMMQAARPSYSRGDTTRALSKGIALVSGEATPVQEVYFLSDMQANAFPLPNEVGTRARNAVLVLVPCGVSAPQNLTLSDLSLRLAVPAPGGTLTVEAEIASRASVPMKTTATLFVDQTKRGAQEIDVRPGARTRVAFSLAVESRGLHEVEVRTGDDALLDDNRRFGALFIPERIRVFVLGGRELESEQYHFLSCALDPFRVAEGGDDLVEIDKAASLPAGLSDYAAVVVLGASVPAETPAVLRGYLAAGGTVIVLPGDDGLPQWLSELAGVEVTKPERTPALPLSFRRRTLSLPPFAMLSGLGPGAFDAVELRKIVGVNLPEQDGEQATPVLLASDGRPVLLFRDFDGGRLFVLTTGADASWGNLVLRGIFPLMIQQMVYQSALAGGVRGISAGVGDSVSLSTPAESVDLTSPSGRVVRLKAQNGNVRVEELDEPGVYRLTRTADGALAAFAAVNAESLEGDLRPIPMDDATRRLENNVGKCLAADDVSSIDEVLNAVREGIPIFDYILGLAAAIVVFETFFANRINPSRGGEGGRPGRAA